MKMKMNEKKIKFKNLKNCKSDFIIIIIIITTIIVVIYLSL
jgi:hypothetical protein